VIAEDTGVSAAARAGEGSEKEEKRVAAAAAPDARERRWRLLVDAWAPSFTALSCSAPRALALALARRGGFREEQCPDRLFRAKRGLAWAWSSIVEKSALDTREGVEIERKSDIIFCALPHFFPSLSQPKSARVLCSFPPLVAMAPHSGGQAGSGDVCSAATYSNRVMKSEQRREN
jgi:hypothetical protein